MKIYFRACMLMLLIPLVGIAAAQEPAEERVIVISGGEDATIKIVGGDNEELEQRTWFDVGRFIESITTYRGEDGKTVIVMRKRDSQVPLQFTVVEATAAALQRARMAEAADAQRARVQSLLLPNRLYAERYGSDLYLRSHSGHSGTAEERRRLSELESESRTLAGKARAAKGEERASLEDELYDLLDSIFDFKQDMYFGTIEEMEEHMMTAEEALEEREENREAIIQRRLSQLLGRSSKFDW